MKIGLIGPLPEPVNGCSYANAVLLRNAGKVSFITVDTNTDSVSGRQGEQFSLRKAISFLRSYAALPRLWSVEVYYLTPGQTFFGFLKYAPFMLLAMARRKPYVLHIHGNHLGSQYAGLVGLKRWLFRLFASRAAAGIVLSDSLRANFNGLLAPERVFVVENFAGDELFAEDALPKPSDMLRVLYLSNLMRGKGILELLDALQILCGRGVRFQATIAGQLEMGIENEVMSRLALLGNTVRYIGPVVDDAKTRVLRESNVFVLPTYYAMEGQPISLLEAMATGNIAVTTPHAGIPDVVGPDNGYFVAPQAADAIANTLADIAADLCNEVARFSSHNIRYARQRFTEGAFVRRTLHVLAWVGNSTGSSPPRHN